MELLPCLEAKGREKSAAKSCRRRLTPPRNRLGPVQCVLPAPGELRDRGCTPSIAPVPPGLPPRTARGRRGSSVVACARPAGIRGVRFAAGCSSDLRAAPEPEHRAGSSPQLSSPTSRSVPAVAGDPTEGSPEGRSRARRRVPRVLTFLDDGLIEQVHPAVVRRLEAPKQKPSAGPPGAAPGAAPGCWARSDREAAAR